jgi:tetratricopeptide (TPR) repeat protein
VTLVVIILLVPAILVGCAIKNPSPSASLVGPGANNSPEESVKRLTPAICAGQGTQADYLERGHAYYQLGQFDQAKKDFGQARQMDGQSALVLLDLGTTAYMQKNYDEALNDLTKALALNSDLGWAYNNRGVVHYTLGDYAKAVTDFSKAAETADVNDKRALFNRALGYQAMKDFDRAIADYDTILAQNPKDIAAMNNKANILIGLRRFDLAIMVLDAAVKISPDDPDLYFNRALAQENLGHLQKAQADYDQTVALNGHFGQAYRNRGVLRLQSQQKNKGCDDLHRACDLGLCHQLEKAKKLGLCD